MLNILIAGCGNIGSRHLQSLKLCNLPLTIYAYDPFKASLEKAKTIWESTQGTNHTIHFINDLTHVPNNIFVSIIATNSADRLNAFKFIAENFTTKHFILEKFLFSKKEEFEIAQTIIDQLESTILVNCPRRIFSAYEILKSQLKNIKIKSIELKGKNWGLCSNTIHFIDLFHFISGKLPQHANFDSASSQLIPSKRQGYLEAFGHLTCTFDEFDAKLTCTDGTFEGIEMTIETNDSIFTVEEKNNTITISKNKEILSTDKIAFQSELTAKYIQNLNSQTSTGLTNYDDSRKMHEVFIEAVENLVAKLNYTSQWKIS